MLSDSITTNSGFHVPTVDVTVTVAEAPCAVKENQVSKVPSSQLAAPIAFVALGGVLAQITPVRSVIGIADAQSFCAKVLLLKSADTNTNAKIENLANFILKVFYSEM